jgi:uncharacterized membrane protein
MDEWMGRLLQGGVTLAAALVLAGGILYLLRHPMPMNYRQFHGEPQDLRSIRGIFANAKALNGPGLIQLGLLVLIATPVARVVYSVAAFAAQKDWKYVIITLIVLGLLCYSLFGHA